MISKKCTWHTIFGQKPVRGGNVACNDAIRTKSYKKWNSYTPISSIYIYLFSMQFGCTEIKILIYIITT